MPNEEDTDKVKYKYPFICHELLKCGNDLIISHLITNPANDFTNKMDLNFERSESDSLSQNSQESGKSKGKGSPSKRKTIKMDFDLSLLPEKDSCSINKEEQNKLPNEVDNKPQY